MKLRSFALPAALVIAGAVQGVSATPIVFYDLTNLPNSDVSTAPATTVATGLSATDITRGPATTIDSLTSGYNSEDFPQSPNNTEAFAKANGADYSFTITVQPGNTATFTSFGTTIHRSGSGPSSFAFDASINGGTPIAIDDPFNYTGTDTNGLAQGPFTLGSQFQNLPGGTTVTFMMYGWNASGTGSFAIGRDNGPDIEGTVVSSVPEPASLCVLMAAGLPLVLRRRR
jgi:hypothetical protein